MGTVLRNRPAHQCIGVKGKPNLASSRVEKSVPLAQYTTFAVGGNADYFCLVRSKNDLKNLIVWCKENNISFLVIGNGSNLLVKDIGFKGLAIKLGDCFKKVSYSNKTITAGAAVSLSVLLQKAKNCSLGGLEPLAGVPGTVAGAVITNAGTSHGEMKDVVSKLVVMDLQGERIIEKKQIGFSYRKSDIDPQKEIITEVEFSLFGKDGSKIGEDMQDYLKQRKKCQPWNLKSAGCVFKNPQEGPAAKFIEEAGLKGFVKGGAEVSRLHANFIINTGTATSSDILELIKIIQKKIQEKFGIFLKPEIKIV